MALKIDLKIPCANDLSNYGNRSFVWPKIHFPDTKTSATFLLI